MIPESLHLEGLHSYRDPVTVDFDDLVEDGLFGIFGPTGSGKSTLLDAMTFALYGEVDRVGGNEVAPLMHPDADTLEVRYGFELGGTSYEARRRYRRPGDGPPSLRDAEIRDVDAGEVLASQAREVEDEVRGLLGMDFDQFTRAVFLPQGKFAQFLQDTPADRVKLLEEVFGLDRYGDTLRRRARDRYRTLEKRREKLEGELQGLEEATPERLEKVEAARGDAAERVETLTERKEGLEADLEVARDLRKAREDLEEAKEKLAALEERDEEVDEDREVLAAAEAAVEPVETLRGLDEAREDLEAVRDGLEAAREDLEEAKENLEDAEATREDRLPALEERAEALHQVEPRLRDLEDEADAWDETRDRLDEMEATVEELEDRGEEAPPEDVARDLADLRDRIQDGLEAARERERLAETVADLEEELEAHRGTIAKREATREDLADVVDELADRAEDLEARVHEVEVGDKAATLAVDLEPGEPCPVCGADDHPDPATEPEADLAGLRGERDDVQETLQDRRGDLEALEARLEEAREREDDLAEDLEAREDELAEAREREEEVREDLPGSLAGTDWEEAEAVVRRWERGRRAQDLRDRADEARDRLEGIRDRWDEVRGTLDLEADAPEPEARATARDRLETSLEAVEAERTRLEEALEEARAAAQEASEEVSRLEGQEENLEASVEALEADLEEALEASPFDAPGDAREAHLPEAEREALAERIEEHEEELRRAREAVERLEGEVEAADMTPAEAQEVVEAHEEVEADLEEAKEDLVRLETLLEDLRDDVERRGDLEEELEEVDDAMGRADALRTLLRGRGFVEFLARNQFQSVLDHASQRLSEVTGGRYHLRGSPESIHIVDHLEGGEERDLRTLSGGETFMASLALALALSDAIQGSRGGGYPPVDFFFLDEGFGSLDRDSLDTVMRMLQELVDQGVHVGLITHVTDVQRYVPRRLMVEPADEAQGSRVRIEK